MPELSKYQRGVCRWPRCWKIRDTNFPHSFTDDTWILPFYCKHHGPIAVKKRLARALFFHEEVE